MGCIHSAPRLKESVIEKASHERRRTQHLIQNLVHEEYRLRVDEVRFVYQFSARSNRIESNRMGWDGGSDRVSPPTWLW
jgi:hypothetical protein